MAKRSTRRLPSSRLRKPNKPPLELPPRSLWFAVDRSWRFSAYSGPMQSVDRSWRFSAYSGPMQSFDRSWRFSAYSGPMQSAPQGGGTGARTKSPAPQEVPRPAGSPLGGLGDWGIGRLGDERHHESAVLAQTVGTVADG